MSTPIPALDQSYEFSHLLQIKFYVSSQNYDGNYRFGYRHIQFL
jgi:hypothetical protein